MKQKCIVFWNEEDHEKLLKWWSSLKGNPGWRAELRRAESPADVLLCQGFRQLTYELAGYWTKEQNLLGLAAVAGVLAHIEKNNGKGFAETCAMPAEGGDREKPAMSELRFAQLQKSRTLNELFIRMVRAVRLLRKTVSPVSVADSILHWTREMVHGETETNPRNRLRVRWGLDYFQNFPKQSTR
jgi:CRISPR system Cascade subunit CasB